MSGYRLKSCVWEITLACCFSCAYCGSCGGKARENELTTDECVDVARQLAELGCRRVSMIGGEVFMRADWQTIVRSLTGRGIAVCIITNGYTLSDKILQALKDCRIESVAVSLDGPADVHDAFRQTGSYDRAIKAIEALTSNGIPTSVISALRSDNYRLLPEFYETLKEWKSKRADRFALLIDGARRVGKSWIAEEFAKSEYASYLLIDFSKASRGIRTIFEENLGDLDTFFMLLEA